MLLYLLLFFNLSSILLFSFNLLLSFVWLLVLFKYSTHLRRKVKCSNLNHFNENDQLEALNSTVDYKKSLFLFAIVFVEFISSFFSIASAVEMLMYVIYEIVGKSNPQNQSYITVFDNNSHMTNYTQVNCKDSPPIILWGIYERDISRILITSYQVSLVFVFTPVYVLMSYYAMIIRNSLNYYSSPKSTELLRKHKILLLGSFVMCAVLLLLLIRVELGILFKLTMNCFALNQLVLTFYYSKKFVRALKWKIMDTKIAFGSDHYKFEYYTRNLKSFVRYFFIYKVMVVAFCTNILLDSFMFTAMFLHPTSLYNVFGFCLQFQQVSTYSDILAHIVHTLQYVILIPLHTSFIALFLLNISTIPFLLSKINLRCRLNIKLHKNCDRSHLNEPLLK